MNHTRIRASAIAGVVFLMAGLLLPANAAAQSSPLLVTTEWLAQKIEQKAPLVILHAGAKADYDAGHIPGAQLPPSFVVATDAAGRASEMPPLADLTAWVRGLGITDKTHVVVYMGTNFITLTTRLFLTLEMLGAPNVSLLDGGLPAWKAENRAVTTDVPAVTASDFAPRVNNSIIVDAKWVKDNLKNSAVTIVDSRNKGFYTGENDAQGRITRPGHIAGAVSLQYPDLFDAGTKFKSVDELKKIFADAGVKPGTHVVTYCHVGFQATSGYFAARLLGYKASMYDGSYSEWMTLTDAPVERTAPAATPPAKQP